MRAVKGWRRFCFRERAIFRVLSGYKPVFFRLFPLFPPFRGPKRPGCRGFPRTTAVADHRATATQLRLGTDPTARLRVPKQSSLL